MRRRAPAVARVRVLQDSRLRSPPRRGARAEPREHWRFHASSPRYVPKKRKVVFRWRYVTDVVCKTNCRPLSSHRNFDGICKRHGDTDRFTYVEAVERQVFRMVVDVRNER